MTIQVPAPRLLPLTIVLIAVLLVLKSFDLARAVMPAQAAAPPSPPPSLSQATGAGPAAAHAEAEAQKQDAAPPPAPDAPPVPLPEPAVSEAERKLLLDLRARRTELDAREAALSARESVAAAAEKRIAARADELAAVQGRLNALEAARKDRDEASWRGLVKTYEAMKPRDAAVIFNDLDLPVLLGVLDRMKEAKAAPVLAAMLPDRARQATAELARLRSRANSADAKGS